MENLSTHLEELQKLNLGDIRRGIDALSAILKRIEVIPFEEPDTSTILEETPLQLHAHFELPCEDFELVSSVTTVVSEEGAISPLLLPEVEQMTPFGQTYERKGVMKIMPLPLHED